MRKLLDRTKFFIKESIPILLPSLIIFMAYDLLSYLNINIGTQDQFYQSSGISKYSALSNGFIPILSVLGLDSNSTFSKILNIALLSIYVLSAVIGFSCSLLFVTICISTSYEKKWSGINNFIWSIVQSKN